MTKLEVAICDLKKARNNFIIASRKRCQIEERESSKAAVPKLQQQDSSPLCGSE
jgi:hypothetical protein